MSDEAWEIGARVGRYRVVPANEHERQQMEAIGHAEFEAVSIGRRGEGPQIAIVPLDESSREIAQHIVALHNASLFEPGRLLKILAKPEGDRTAADLDYIARLERAERSNSL